MILTSLLPIDVYLAGDQVSNVTTGNVTRHRAPMRLSFESRMKLLLEHTQEYCSVMQNNSVTITFSVLVMHFS